MSALTKLGSGESRASLEELWIEMDAEDRQRIIRALCNGEVLAEGRWFSAGHNPPYSEALHPFSFICREAWHGQEFDTASAGKPICVCPGVDDPSQGFVDIQLVNCEKLIEILDLDPDQRGPEISLVELAVDGQKMSAKVWAAMAAMVGRKTVPLSPSAIAKALLDRDDLWSHGTVDFDRLRKYAKRFINEIEAFA